MVSRACYNCTCDMFSPTLSPFDQASDDVSALFLPQQRSSAPPLARACATQDTPLPLSDWSVVSTRDIYMRGRLDATLCVRSSADILSSCHSPPLVRAGTPLVHTSDLLRNVRLQRPYQLPGDIRFKHLVGIDVGFHVVTKQVSSIRSVVPGADDSYHISSVNQASYKPGSSLEHLIPSSPPLNYRSLIQHVIRALIGSRPSSTQEEVSLLDVLRCGIVRGRQFFVVALEKSCGAPQLCDDFICLTTWTRLVQTNEAVYTGDSSVAAHQIVLGSAHDFSIVLEQISYIVSSIIRSCSFSTVVPWLLCHQLSVSTKEATGLLYTLSITYNYEKEGEKINCKGRAQIHGARLEEAPHVHTPELEEAPHVHTPELEEAPHVHTPELEEAPHVHTPELEEAPHVHTPELEEAPHVHTPELEEAPHVHTPELEEAPHVHTPELEEAPHVHTPELEEAPHVHTPELEEAPHVHTPELEEAPHVHTPELEEAPHVHTPELEEAPHVHTPELEEAPHVHTPELEEAPHVHTPELEEAPHVHTPELEEAPHVHTPELEEAPHVHTPELEEAPHVHTPELEEAPHGIPWHNCFSPSKYTTHFPENAHFETLLFFWVASVYEKQQMFVLTDEVALLMTIPCPGSPPSLPPPSTITDRGVKRASNPRPKEGNTHKHLPWLEFELGSFRGTVVTSSAYPGQMGTEWGRTYHRYSCNKLCLPWSNGDRVGENISQYQGPSVCQYRTQCMATTLFHMSYGRYLTHTHVPSVSPSHTHMEEETQQL
uniref:Uncharacterized protein n=1 Tax=Timema cristinae TaxID=61476 RepID=A0A7R9H953_TIMCR|nr:unnamed protein product [Timema cristinae]